LTAMMMIGLMYSGSRGGWCALLAAIAALVIFGIRNGTVSKWVPVTSASFFVVLFAFVFSCSGLVRHRIELGTNLFAGGALNQSSQVQLALDAYHTAREHPFFGTGPGTFAFIHSRDPISTLSWENVLIHDDYLNCVDDYGLVGFALVMFFVAAVTLKFFQPLWVDNRWQDRTLVATGLAAWCALLVHSWFDYNLHVPALALLLFALTGLAMGRIKRDNGNSSNRSANLLPPLGPWLGWAVVGLSIAFGGEIVQTAFGVLDVEKNATYTERLSLVSPAAPEAD
jgi:hypothetical protein